MPGNVKSIGDSAFLDCGALKSITIPKKVESIGENAFMKCRELTSVTIPKNVKSIGYAAFCECNKLKTINIKTKKLNYVGEYAFLGISENAKIKVPSAKLKYYKKLLKDKGQEATVRIVK